MMKRIWLIDEQDNYREGVKILLEMRLKSCSVETFRFISYADYENSKRKPDLVIVDPAVENHAHLKRIDTLLEKNMPVVFLSLENDRNKILLYLRKNISGYLTKSMATKDLVESIDGILAGNRYIHPSVGTVLLDAFHSNIPLSKVKMERKAISCST